jgi:hypothetical protein
MSPIPDAVEAWHAVIVAGDRLAVDDAGARAQANQRLDDQREAVGQVVAGAAIEPQRSWPSLKTSFLPCASVTLYARVARDSAEAAVRARGVMGKDGRFDVAVTFDERRGYVGTHPELRAPVTALSLGGLRRKVEAAMLPEEVIVMLSLDKAARLERDRRRLTGRTRPGFAGTSA